MMEIDGEGKNNIPEGMTAAFKKMLEAEQAVAK
jgi:hypothetical protein